MFCYPTIKNKKKTKISRIKKSNVFEHFYDFFIVVLVEKYKKIDIIKIKK